jgi:hypothetical protein
MPHPLPRRKIQIVLYAFAVEGDRIPLDSSALTAVLVKITDLSDSKWGAQFRRFDDGPLPEAEAKIEIVQDAVRQAVDVHFALDKFFNDVVAKSPTPTSGSEAIQ